MKLWSTVSPIPSDPTKTKNTAPGEERGSDVASLAYSQVRLIGTVILLY